MTDAFQGEDDRLRELMETCEHEHGVIVCVDCGATLPAPNGAYDLWEGEIIR